MNYLAHGFLAGPDPALVVGGVAGDWVKGPLPGLLPQDLAWGVALHRAIDAFAETHPAFCRSRARMSAGRRRYAGVLVDIFYDHLLARDWLEFSNEGLNAYCAGVYRQIGFRQHELPESSQSALALMAREDWLQSYRDLTGIADVLGRMSRRARQPNPLSGGEEEFMADPLGFTNDFRWWLEDAKSFAEGWRANIFGS